MSNVTIRDLPVGTTLAETDEFVFNDDGVDKRLSKEALRADLDVWISKYTTDQLSTATSLRAGNLVRTPGYYASGDGGGNDFIVEERDGSAEDGGSIIFIDGTDLQLKGLFPGDVVHLNQFGVTGDGISSDKNKLLSALSLGLPVYSSSNLNYNIEDGFDVSAPTVIYMNGSEFTFTNSVSGSTPAITISGRIIADNLVFNIPAGVTIDRAIEISANESKIKGNLNVISVDQQNNRSTSEHAMVIISGDDVEISNIKVLNVDSPAKWSGANGKMGYFYCENYVRAFWASAVNNFNFEKIHAKGRSPNATLKQAGHNGVLAGNLSGFYGDLILIEDSAEHGVRFSANQLNTGDIRVNTIRCYRSGGSGTKFRCNDAYKITKIYIGEVYSEDCGGGSDGNTYLDDEDGLRLERVDGGHVGILTVKRNLNSYSCGRGIRYTDAHNFTIGSVNIYDSHEEPLRIQTLILDDDSNNINVSSDNLTIFGGKIVRPRLEAINFELRGTAEISSVNFVNLVGEDLLKQGILTSNFDSTVTPTNCHIDFRWTIDPSNTSVPVRILGGSAPSFHIDIKTDSAPSAGSEVGARGSTWIDSSTGTKYIRTTDDTWAALN